VENPVYLNGVLLPRDQAQIPVLDRGFLFGDGVYEVIPAYAGRLFRLRQHLDRLGRSLAGIRLANPHTDAAWQDLLHRLLESSPGTDQAVYLQITRGAAPKRDHAFPSGIAPTVFAMANPMDPMPAQVAEQGVAAITLADIRWDCCHLKTITLLANVLLRQQAVDAGTAEAILIRDGLVTEGAASNLFLVRDDRLITPPHSQRLLPGITRDLVLELASAGGIPWSETDIAATELDSADEIWLTSSTKEVLPVTRLNGHAIGNGRPGPLWQAMLGLYRGYKERVHHLHELEP
jgi:D-alanine transaminase